MKTQSYNTFWQRIHRLAKTEGFPLRVMLELTYRCNFRCRHCYVPMSYRKKKELKIKEIFSILSQLKDLGCFYLGFTGGEPFVRKDIIDILWFAKKQGFELIIYTNGSLINKEIASQLLRLRPNKIDITIPAMSNPAFEQITRMPGSHRKVFKAIDLLHKRGVKLGFKTCVLKENKSQIKEIQDFAASLGALHRLDDILSPRLDGSKDPFKYRNSSKFSVRGLRLADGCYWKIPPTANRPPQTAHLFKCGAGLSQAAITPSGELKMCLMIDYPRFPVIGSRFVVSDNRRTPQTEHQTPNLEESWMRLKELVSSIKPDENYQCDKCELYAYCKWCPARAWLENRNFTSCDSESRRWAELRRNAKL